MTVICIQPHIEIQNGETKLSAMFYFKMAAYMCCHLELTSGMNVAPIESGNHDLEGQKQQQNQHRAAKFSKEFSKEDHEENILVKRMVINGHSKMHQSTLHMSTQKCSIAEFSWIWFHFFCFTFFLTIVLLNYA